MTILRKEQTYVDSFLRFIQQEKGLSKNTTKAYLQDINFFLRWTQFKKVSIADINEVCCEDFIFHLRDNYSVLLTAGKWHGLEGYIRFGYGTPTDYVMGGLEKIAQYLKEFSE